MANNLFTEVQLETAYIMFRCMMYDPTRIIFTGLVHTRRGRQYRVYSHNGLLCGQEVGSNDNAIVEMTFEKFLNWEPASGQLIRTSGPEVQVILGSLALVQMNDVLEE